MKTIKEIISEKPTWEITISWFIDTIRDHKKYIFLILRQKTEFIQIFIEKEKFEWIEFKPESFIEITWVLQYKEEIKLHSMELIAESIEILSQTLEELPISWKWEWYPSMTERLDHRHISLREPKILLAFEMMSCFDLKVREFFYKRWFMEIHTPKIIWTSSEWWAELFEMEYFEKKAYLAQSPQIYKQMAIAAWFEKVLEIAPAFRADPSFTSRHVTEITMLDVEMWPIKSYHEILEIESEMLAFTLAALKEEFSDKVRALYWLEIEVPTLPFPTLRFRECVEILKEEFGIEILEWEDMSSEWEKKMAEYIKRELWHDFLFITEYPSSVRAFYTMTKDWEAPYSTWFDLIYKGLEITSWAQREHRHDILRSKIIEKWMWVDGFYHYLEAFKHGIPPHWWFGFWFARLFKQMLGYDTIKEMILMPRDPKRIFP
ncbi:MAG: Aspartyl-tRNA synthetase [uncultured bacterium (gcode 4)]|uniref:Aspartyl-tRNA synthetase n=1 Tax=uncultured bacterium (gcode 4) TaxID=1234023 RepID=K2GGI0_9BACT|nr:MAG: Aspartyl-tRNA synthetase [uncultured bacterium (gcode 4)]